MHHHRNQRFHHSRKESKRWKNNLQRCIKSHTAENSKNQPEEAPARWPTVPPAAPTQARKPTQTTEPEPTTQPNPPPPSLDKGDTAAIQTAMEQQASTEQTQPVTCKS